MENQMRKTVLRKTILGTLYSDNPGKKLTNDNLEEEGKLLKKKQDKILGKVNVRETKIMEMAFVEDTLLTDEEMTAKEDAYMSELYDKAQEEALNNKDWSEEEKILNSSEPASFEKRLELKIK